MKIARCADLLYESGCATSSPRIRARARHFLRGGFAMVAFAFAGIVAGQAETGVFAISAATINAGGNHASGGVFSVDGSIAQPVAGAALTGGPYQLDSGFQSLDTDAIFKSGFE